MIETGLNIVEQKAEEAFSRQSWIFDELYSGNTIVNYKRQRVRNQVLGYLQPGSSILELNSGTGEDAIFFAQQGLRVHATDISRGMQAVLKQKVEKAGLQNNISTELCSFTQLIGLQNRGPYDLVFSNFAGLNCTGQLGKVLDALPGLVKPGGLVTLVLLPKFCLWETLLIFKGKFKTATRRLFSNNGAKAHIEGTYFKCWYYHPGFIRRHLAATFDCLSIEGLCTIVPPSYIEGFAEKYHRTYQLLTSMENRYKARWPWPYIGDYYIITLRKKVL